MISACIETKITKLNLPQVVFTVPLPGRDPVYMSMHVSDYSKEHLAVVIVDSNKFLNHWRADPSQPKQGLAYGSPETWPNDYKYQDAVEGFSLGRANPVPLADVGFNSRTIKRVKRRFGFKLGEERKTIDYVRIGNGNTRTIWLLTHGCPAFPVHCYRTDAEALFKATGAIGTNFYSVGNLVELLTEHPRLI